jgi:hypothetical protein
MRVSEWAMVNDVTMAPAYTSAARAGRIAVSWRELARVTTAMSSRETRNRMWSRPYAMCSTPLAAKPSRPDGGSWPGRQDRRVRSGADRLAVDRPTATKPTWRGSWSRKRL